MAAGAIVAGGALASHATAGAATGAAGATATTTLPAPADSGIDHIIVLMMENRTFDHFLGWVPGADGNPVGYHDADDLDFWRQAAPDWTVCDRYFAATMAETHPNRFYQHSAATDRTDNSTVTSTLPTI